MTLASRLVFVFFVVASAASPATADCYSGRFGAPPPPSPTVDGTILAIDWAKTPPTAAGCAPSPGGRTFCEALANGGAWDAQITVKLHHRTDAAGVRLPDPGTVITLTGRFARTQAECGPSPLELGQDRTFRLEGLEVHGLAPLPPPVHKASGCAGCDAGPAEGSLLVVLLAFARMLRSAT